MTKYLELIVDKGSDFTQTIILNNELTNMNVNLVNYSARSSMRRSHYSINATASFTCTIVDGPNGVINVSMTSANTGNIRPGRYVYDLEIVSGTGIVTRPYEGLVHITPESSY